MTLAIIPGNEALLEQRDLLRIQIAKLEAIIGNANAWVEGLEADIALTSDDGAALLTMATNLNTQLSAETSITSIAGLNVRIRNTLGIQNKTAL